MSNYFDQNTQIWYTGDGVAVTTLYIASLVGKVTRDEIINCFSGFGKIEKVQVFSKKPHSHGFITFQYAQSATNALAAQFHEHKLKVAIAKDRRQGQQFTYKTVTQLVDLNDDCLEEIFSFLDDDDLCALARTSLRFNRIASRIFNRKYEVFNLMSKSYLDAGRVLVTFGQFISNLSMKSYCQSVPCDQRLLEWLTSNCSEKLKSLRLVGFAIPKCLTVKLRSVFTRLLTLKIESCSIAECDKELFADCGSLRELSVCDVKSRRENGILTNTFPKLERLKIIRDDGDWREFLSRHSNLRSLHLQVKDLSNLPCVAEYCKELKEIEIFLYGYSEAGPQASLLSLFTLHGLQKITIMSFMCPIPILTRQLNSLESLQYLNLSLFDMNESVISAIAELNRLKVLHLFWLQLELPGRTYHLNIDQLGNLHQLTELSISSDCTIELDVIRLVKRLSILKTLTLSFMSFRVDMKLFLKIEDVIRQRPDRTQQTLEIACYKSDDLLCDVNNRRILKLIPF